MIEIRYEREELFDVNMMIVMRVKYRGELANVDKAFAKAVSNNGILLTKVELRDDGRAFYVPNDIPRSSIAITSDDLDKVRVEQEKIRFRIEEGEYIRAFVNNDEILFLMNHLGGDGKSLLYFIEDFFQAASGEELSYKEMHEVVVPTERIGALSDLYLNYANGKWCDRKYTLEDLDQAYQLYWSTMSTSLTETIKDESGLLSELHSRGIGYTSYLIAQYIKDRPGMSDVGLAVDIREKNDRSMGNYASGISIKVKYDARKDIFENAMKIHGKLHKKLSNETKKYFILNFMARMKPSLVDSMSMVHAGIEKDAHAVKIAKIAGYGEKTKDLSITNLTRADIRTEYGNCKIDFISFAGPVVSYGKDVIGCCTVNNTTVITRHKRTCEAT